MPGLETLRPLLIDRQVAQWQANGVIRRYTAIVDWDRAAAEGPDSIAEIVTAFIDVSVAPARSVGFDDVAERISRFPEVLSVYLVSGGHDLRCTVTGRSIAPRLFVSLGASAFQYIGRGL